MHSSVTPCQRCSFPRMIPGKVRKAIAQNISGMSTTREAFIPATILLAGTAKGDKVTDKPDTSTRLNRFAPMILPSDKDPWPFAREVMAVTSSGKEVPRATKVSAMTLSGTPKAVNAGTYKATAAAPTTSPTTSRMGLEYSCLTSSAGSTGGIFFTRSTLYAM